MDFYFLYINVLFLRLIFYGIVEILFFKVVVLDVVSFFDDKFF